MTFDEYNKKLEVLNADHQENKRVLARMYAIDNNVVKLDDIVVDHFQSIRVESIKQAVYEKPPCCVYFGPVLKKDGWPRKDGAVGTMFQCNLETINGEKYEQKVKI